MGEQVHLAEETETIIGPLREWWKVAAAKAQEWTGTRAQNETERLRAALTWVQEAADRGEDFVGLEDGSDGPSGTEGEAEDAGPPAPKTCRWCVITSRPNTAEVVIVHPAVKGKGPAEPVVPEEVSDGSLSAELRADEE